MNEVDFHITAKPISIELECTNCDADIVITWEEIEVPECWGDDWGEIECPQCGGKVLLGDYEDD